jgi:hypothetical protein
MQLNRPRGDAQTLSCRTVYIQMRVFGSYSIRLQAPTRHREHLIQRTQLHLRRTGNMDRPCKAQVTEPKNGLILA